MSLHDQSQPFVPSEFAPKPMMTLRDHIAIEAMKAHIIYHGERGGFINRYSFAYSAADAMLAERDK
jgi:hypothetical protein